MSYHHPGDCHEHHGLVRDFDGERPTIVCLCGSTRFREAFARAALERTYAGEIVLTLHDLGRGVPAPAAQMAALDELHRRQIDLADYVLIVSDEAGYFGDSTRGEIEYARAHGRPVRFAVPAAEARWMALAEGVFT